eukprot:m.73009 g.73009  ORF g.73009 m.73009 type:complete len:317 (-) comp14302_c0_seq1:981-1931(-)
MKKLCFAFNNAFARLGHRLGICCLEGQRFIFCVLLFLVSELAKLDAHFGAALLCQRIKITAQHTDEANDDGGRACQKAECCFHRRRLGLVATWVCNVACSLHHAGRHTQSNSRSKFLEKDKKRVKQSLATHACVQLAKVNHVWQHGPRGEVRRRKHASSPNAPHVQGPDRWLLRQHICRNKRWLPQQNADDKRSPLAVASKQVQPKWKRKHGGSQQRKQDTRSLVRTLQAVLKVQHKAILKHCHTGPDKHKHENDDDVRSASNGDAKASEERLFTQLCAIRRGALLFGNKDGHHHRAHNRDDSKHGGRHHKRPLFL